MLTPAAYEKAASWLDDRLYALPGEPVAVHEADGRVTAASLGAPRDYPPAAAAAADGYALCAGATVGASEYNPLQFRVNRSRQGAEPGAAHPVVSGQPLPAGTDAVLSVLDAELRGEELELFGSLAAGDNVVPAGAESRAEAELLEAGRVLRPVDIGLAVELEIGTLEVVRRPCVRLATLRGDQPDAAGAMIGSLVIRDGGTVQRSRGGNELFAGDSVDLWLALGGTGFGLNDGAVEALESAGELVFRGVAMNPGETVSIGLVDATPAILLPGTPLAAWFAYELLAGRAVRRLAGRPAELPYGSRRLALTRKIASGLGRMECCRLRVTGDRAEPIAVADNRTLSTAVRADGFALVPEHSEGFPAGSEVTAYMYDQRF